MRAMIQRGKAKIKDPRGPNGRNGGGYADGGSYPLAVVIQEAGTPRFRGRVEEDLHAVTEGRKISTMKNCWRRFAPQAHSRLP